MSNEIISESVKDAFVRKLVTLFPSPTYFVFTESVSPTSLRFPHFFLFQLSSIAQEERKGYWWIDYLINIRYRHVDNPAIFGTDLEYQLDKVSYELIYGMDNINWFGKPHKITMAQSNEKIDGVLQCFYNLRIGARKPIEEVAKQMTLELNLR
jgi:hypothetical protein